MNNELAVTKHIRNLERDYMKEKIALLIIYLHDRSKLSVTNLAFDVDDLCNELKKNYSDLTLVEVRIALVEGTKNEYNALTVTNYVKWLNAYKEDKLAKAKQLKVYEERKALEPSDEEKEKMFQENLKHCIETYRRTKIVDDKGNAIYNRLERDGVISFSEAEKQSVREYAAINESTRLHTELNKSVNINDIRSIRQEIKKFNEGKVSLDSEIKRLLLERYLIKLIKNG
jgi:hypothetical protein